MRRPLIRPVLVLLHRYVGLATALFLLIVGLTGALLAWRHPLSALLSPELHHAPGRGAVLAPAELAARAKEAEPRARIDGWPLHLVEGDGVSFYLQPDIDAATGKSYTLGYDQIWLDPVSGAVLGRVDSQAFPPTRHSLMSFVYRLHYALALPGRWGVWIMGIVAILWFFDCFVGAALTFPRGRPFFAKWKPAWRVKRKRLNYDLHRAGGLWPWVLLATMALSGVSFNLRSEVFLPLFDRVAARTREPYDSRAVDFAIHRGPGSIAPEQAIAIAADTARALGWTARPEGLYRSAGQGFWQVYYMKSAAQWATAGGYSVFIDDANGEVIYLRTPGGTGGDVFLNWVADLHLGGVGGTPYKAVLSLLGSMIASLSVTGVVIWWRKQRGQTHIRWSRPTVGLDRD